MTKTHNSRPPSPFSAADIQRKQPLETRPDGAITKTFCKCPPPSGLGQSPLRRVYSGTAHCGIALEGKLAKLVQVPTSALKTRAVSVPLESCVNGVSAEESQDSCHTLLANWTINSIFEEQEIDCAGELSCFESDDESRALSGKLSIAESIKPKESVTARLDCDSAHLGFWADVGASTFGLYQESDLAASVSCEFSDWESGSESDDEEEATLLPWDF